MAVWVHFMYRWVGVHGYDMIRVVHDITPSWLSFSRLVFQPFPALSFEFVPNWPFHGGGGEAGHQSHDVFYTNLGTAPRTTCFGTHYHHHIYDTYTYTYIGTTYVPAIQTVHLSKVTGFLVRKEKRIYGRYTWYDLPKGINILSSKDLARFLVQKEEFHFLRTSSCRNYFFVMSCDVTICHCCED